MSVQPCGCDMTEEAWPWAHATLDPATANGVKCGVDESGDTIVWSYPTSDIAGYTVATKSAASAVPTGVSTAFGAKTEQAGAAYFNGIDTFTAPIAGMYAFTVSALSVASVVFLTYFRMVSNYAPWGSPIEKTQTIADAVLGGSITLSGVLPCAAAGTLIFDLLQDRGAPQDYTDIYMAFYWHSPIPS